VSRVLNALSAKSVPISSAKSLSSFIESSSLPWDAERAMNPDIHAYSSKILMTFRRKMGLGGCLLMKLHLLEHELDLLLRNEAITIDIIDLERN